MGKSTEKIAKVLALHASRNLDLKPKAYVKDYEVYFFEVNKKTNKKDAGG